MAATYAIESPLATPLGPTSASPQQQTQPAEANVKLQTVTPPGYLPAYPPQGGQMIVQSSGGPQAPAVVPMQFGQVPNQHVPVLYQLPNQQGAYIATSPVYQPPNPPQVVYPPGMINTNQPLVICQPPIVQKQGAVTPHPGVALGESLGLQ